MKIFCKFIGRKEFLPARLVFEGAAGDKPNYAVEDNAVKGEKLLKDPKSFDVQKDYLANVSRIEKIAKDKGVSILPPAVDPEYKAALDKLDDNKNKYENTLKFVVEKAKSWPILKDFVAEKSRGLGGYQKGLEASKAFDALYSPYSKMAGDDPDFTAHNKISDNIKYAMNGAMVLALEYHNDFLDELDKGGDFKTDYITKLGMLRECQSALLLMSENNFYKCTGDVGTLKTETTTKLDRIAKANIKITELNLKAAADTVKALANGGDEDKLKQAKSWEAGAKANVQMEQNKNVAIQSKLKAENVLTPTAYEEAGKLFKKAESLAGSDVVAAAKLFLEAQTAFDAAVKSLDNKEQGKVDAARVAAKGAFDAIPKTVYYSTGARAMDFLATKFNADWNNAIKEGATKAEQIANFDLAKASYEKLGGVVKAMNAAGAEYEAIVKSEKVYLARPENKGVLPEFNESKKGTFTSVIDTANNALYGNYDTDKAATEMVKVEQILKDKFRPYDYRPKLNDAEKATLNS